MRPRMLWSTSTLSTLSTLISNVCRLIKPVLWTTRKLVTSVSVVQRWNQAVTVLYNAATAEIAASDRQISAGGPTGTMPESTRNAPAIIQPMIAGRKNIQCALVEYSTFSPGCRMSSIYRPIRCPELTRYYSHLRHFWTENEAGCLLRTAPLCIRRFWPGRSNFRAGQVTYPHRECTRRHGPPSDEIRRYVRRQYRPNPQRRAACEARSRCGTRRRRGGVGDVRQDQRTGGLVHRRLADARCTRI